MAKKNGKSLVIVESPAKAKTIAGYLGPGYVVEASYGHVRDLPRNAADVPLKHKGEAWARLGVDVDNDFAALYVISPDRTNVGNGYPPPAGSTPARAPSMSPFRSCVRARTSLIGCSSAAAALSVP